MNSTGNCQLNLCLTFCIFNANYLKVKKYFFLNDANFHVHDDGNVNPIFPFEKSVTFLSNNPPDILLYIYYSLFLLKHKLVFADHFGFAEVVNRKGMR